MSLIVLRNQRRSLYLASRCHRNQSGDVLGETKDTVLNRNYYAFNAILRSWRWREKKVSQFETLKEREVGRPGIIYTKERSLLPGIALEIVWRCA